MFEPIYNSKKAGLDAEELPGILTVMVLFVILVLVFYVINFFDQLQKQKQVEISFKELNANFNLNYFLLFQLEGDTTIADLISQAYLNNNYEQLKTLFNKFFGEIYDKQGLSYDLIIDGINMNSVNFVGKVTESSIQVPIINKRAITVKLLIGGSG